ncbi:hypothetical protein BJX70DRAFT_399450 [Aspergillus crustosus]
MPPRRTGYTELPPGGLIVHSELDLEEDLESELHEFVRLCRMGYYSDAETFFDNVLEKHLRLFPVIAEYADMLLEQGRYRQAVEFLSHHLSVSEDTLNPLETQLLILMRSFANIHLKGALRSALVEARCAWTRLQQARNAGSEAFFTETEARGQSGYH